DIVLVGEQIFYSAVYLSAFVDAGALEGGDAGGGASEADTEWSAGRGHVAEAAVPVSSDDLAFLDVLDALVHGRFSDVDAGVAGRAQGHDLADGHGDVGFLGHRVVAPAALAVLGFLDQADRPNQRGPEPFTQGAVLNHAVRFAEEQCAEAVAVHGAVRLRIAVK